MPRSKNTIFVQIASYRDPELLPTLRSLFENAKYPNNLRIALAWQHDKNESLEEFADDSRVVVLDIPAKEARGVCWARNMLQYLYKGEKFTLQLDSHHRFTKHWDAKLIKMLRDLQKKGHPKPLITSYLTHYDPKVISDEERSTEPWKLTFQRFLHEGPAFPIPHTIDEHKELTEPLPARFYSAHFAFSVGEFCLEVPHDPDFYFHGEEPSIAARAFTWGYDLFHPHYVIAWHEYTREGKPKHWDDNEWVSKNNESYLKYRKLFSIGNEVYDPDEFGRFGLGTVRSLDDYKRFSGVDLSAKTAQDWAKSGDTPPAPYDFDSEQEYLDSFKAFNKQVANVHVSEVDEGKDYDFWAIIFKSSDGEEVHRDDADAEELKHILANKDGDWHQVWREWYGEEATKYVVWPHSEKEGWLEPIYRDL